MTKKCDLLIHFDEAQQKFIFYSIDVKDTAELRQKTFDGACPDVVFFKDKTPDEAERSLGSMVFAGLDHGSINKVNIRNYQAESAAAIENYCIELEISSANGDPEAQFALHLEYYRRANKSKQLPDLQKAEDLLFSSAKSGHKNAISMLENWTILKERAIQRMNEG